MATAPRTPQGVPPGHGTDGLGPSDISDTGADVAGGPGLGGAADEPALDGDHDTDRVVGADDPSPGLTDGPMTPDGRTLPDPPPREVAQDG